MNTCECQLNFSTDFIEVYPLGPKVKMAMYTWQSFEACTSYHRPAFWPTNFSKKGRKKNNTTKLNTCHKLHTSHKAHSVYI